MARDGWKEARKEGRKGDPKLHRWREGEKEREGVGIRYAGSCLVGFLSTVACLLGLVWFGLVGLGSFISWTV